MRLHRAISFISMPESKTKEIHSELSPILLKEHKAFKNPYGWKNVTVVAKSGTKKLVNVKMESSLIQLFHACDLGFNFQLNKHSRECKMLLLSLSHYINMLLENFSSWNVWDTLRSGTHGKCDKDDLGQRSLGSFQAEVVPVFSSSLMLQESSFQKSQGEN